MQRERVTAQLKALTRHVGKHFKVAENHVGLISLKEVFFFVF